jgi:Carbohydrate binding module (family 6)
MKKNFYLIALLCLVTLGVARPGLAVSSTTNPADLIERLEKEGWEQVQPGVMQRTAESGEIETLGFGTEGLRFKLAEMKAHLEFLRKEFARRPSGELRKAIRSYRAEIQRTEKALKKGGKAGSLESSTQALVAGTGCTANYDGIASVLPLTKGASAEAEAYFENGCGYTGEVYAHAFAEATSAANEKVTMTQSDPAPNGFRIGGNVAASAAVTVNGVRDCYSYAYASVTSYDLDLVYSQSATNSTCPQQTPFRGTPFAAPGTIKAVDFDNGGEGIAYHDASPGNTSWSSYRMTDVDMYEDSAMFLEAGDWLEYTVDVASADTYTVVAQVNGLEPGGLFHIELDGVNVTGPLAVPVTPSGGYWSSVVKAGVSLPAGRHVLRIVADTWFYSFYSLRIVKAQAPFGGIPRTLPGTIRAADFDEGGEQIGYHDNTVGCYGSCEYRLADVDRWEHIVWHTGTGEWMKYTVDVTATGTYTLALRVGAEEGGAIFHVEFDGVDVTGPLTMPTTGSWSALQTITKTGVSLTAGRKVMRIVIDDAKGRYDAGTFDTITLQP